MVVGIVDWMRKCYSVFYGCLLIQSMPLKPYWDWILLSIKHCSFGFVHDVGGKPLEPQQNPSGVVVQTRRTFRTASVCTPNQNHFAGFC